jgi:hypothetical protein
MPQKRWPKPCKFCKGELTRSCMICGWKKQKKRIRDMSNSELAELQGKRNRVQFAHELDRGSTRAGNCNTQNWSANHIIERHREWALEIFDRVESGEDIKAIAKDTDMTVAIINNIHKLMVGKEVRGDFRLQVNSYTPTNPLPPEPMVLPGGVRQHVSWAEESNPDAWESF